MPVPRLCKAPVVSFSSCRVVLSCALNPFISSPTPRGRGAVGGWGVGGEEGFGCSQWWSLKPGATETSRWKERKREWKNLLFLFIFYYPVLAFPVTPQQTRGVIRYLAHLRPRWGAVDTEIIRSPVMRPSVWKGPVE